MKEVKIIFISVEIVMLIAVPMLLFLTDWEKATEEGADWMVRLMITLAAYLAVIFQREQQAISWEED